MTISERPDASKADFSTPDAQSQAESSPLTSSRHRHPYRSPAYSDRLDRSHHHSHSHDESGAAHPHIHHPHIHSEESLRRIVNRLSRVEGHIRGIKTMVKESRPCPEVLVQIAAVRGALDRVARIILDEHLTECVGRAASEGNIDEEIDALKAALDRFLP